MLVPNGAASGLLSDPTGLDGFSPGKAVAGAQNVELEDVRVSLDVYPTFLRVEATYTLASHLDLAQEIPVGIPVRNLEIEIRGEPLEDLQVEIDGQRIDDHRRITERICLSREEESWILRGPRRRCEGKVFERKWRWWPVPLEPRGRATTTVRYLQFMTDAEIYDGSLSSYVHQAFGTGALWRGPIGKVEVTARIHGIDHEDLVVAENNLRRDGNELQWTFEDFEPTARQGVGLRVKTATADLDGRVHHAAYLPADTPHRLRIQDYLLRFVAADTKPTTDDWIWLVEQLRTLEIDPDDPRSRAWAHDVLADLYDWAEETLREPPEAEEIELPGGFAPTAAQPQGTDPPPNPEHPPEVQRALDWLRPAELDEEASGAAVFEPFTLGRIRYFHRRCHVRCADSLFEAAQVLHWRRIRRMGMTGGALVLLLAWVAYRRWRRRHGADRAGRA